MSTAPYNQPVANIDMMGAERVQPNGILYGKLNSECVNSEIRLVKFTPVSTITQAKGNDVIRFAISNDGFFDPFSAYLKIRVETNDLATDEVRFLDRSAHSFISRIVIRSNGVEIMRNDNYDVKAAMINDMLYSPEQMKQHHWEGFPTQKVSLPVGFDTTSADSFHLAQLAQYNSMLAPGAPAWDYMVGEHAFYNDQDCIGGNDNMPKTSNQGAYLVPSIGKAQYSGSGGAGTYRSLATPSRTLPNQDYLYHLGNKQGKPVGMTASSSGGYAIAGNKTREFIIPLYDGFLGCLMPQKKFIPLAFLPLDIEFTLNPHALYSSHTFEEGGKRNYTVTRFELISHVLFFDQSINISLENAIAQYGLYLHCNDFTLAPVTVTTQGSSTVPAIIQIGMSHKSINSIHLVFYYQLYESTTQARKLHFVSHNLTRLQVRNGTQFIPSEPMVATDISHGSGDTYDFSHLQFLVETLKGWNKLHDPATDCMIDLNSWGSDVLGIQQSPILTLGSLKSTNSSETTPASVLTETYAKQALIGRTQYAINMEGEELGEEKQLISGRSGKMPFDLQLTGVKTELQGSYSNVFLRHDYIVQIRSDLLIQVSGR